MNNQEIVEKTPPVENVSIASILERKLSEAQAEVSALNKKLNEANKTLAEVEREYILRALDSVDGNKAKAAAVLGVSIKTLYNKLNSYKADGLL